MPSIPQIVDALRTVLIDSAHAAAQATGFSQRQRRMDGAQFVQTLVGTWLAQQLSSGVALPTRPGPAASRPRTP